MVKRLDGFAGEQGAGSPPPALVKGVQKYYKMQTSLYQMWLDLVGFIPSELKH